MHFHREIDSLKQKILQLGGLVEDRVRKACSMIESKDQQLAQELLVSDWEIDDMEIMVEEECLKVLALHQPVARDLRLIIAIIKINNELERVADIAVNIAKRILTITKYPKNNAIFDYQPMAEKVLEMVKISLDALVTEDAKLARQLFVMDEEVDQYRNLAYREVVQTMDAGGNEGNGAYLINTYLIARHLERIADRTNNIAEEVIYLVEGEIVRGGGELP
jgi:phosphate transport system protein